MFPRDGIQQASFKLSEKLYKQADPEAAGETSAANGASKGDSDVIDAEFEEADK